MQAIQKFFTIKTKQKISNFNFAQYIYPNKFFKSLLLKGLPVLEHRLDMVTMLARLKDDCVIDIDQEEEEEEIH